MTTESPLEPARALGLRQSSYGWQVSILAGNASAKTDSARRKAGWHQQADWLAFVPAQLCDAALCECGRREDHSGANAALHSGCHDGHLRQSGDGGETACSEPYCRADSAAREQHIIGTALKSNIGLATIRKSVKREHCVSVADVLICDEVP